VVTSKQRREQSRRLLERQLEARQQHEAARRRRTLIATIAGTVIVAVVVVVIVIAVSGNDNKKPAASGSTSASPATSASATPSPARTATGPAVTFKGVTVKGATDLGGAPGVTSKSSTDPKKIEYKDLVVGEGQAATPASSVTVQYTGVLYKKGTQFDSSWTRGQPAQFSLTGVVKGFTQGIGGTTGVPPMKVGGRRIIIMPASLGYGAQANGPIPANSSLVFVVDLAKVG
jgi:FKBP-type peptidyl-prolyl cis-trans isomerase